MGNGIPALWIRRQTDYLLICRVPSIVLGWWIRHIFKNLGQLCHIPLMNGEDDFVDEVWCHTFDFLNISVIVMRNALHEHVRIKTSKFATKGFSSKNSTILLHSELLTRTTTSQIIMLTIWPPSGINMQSFTGRKEGFSRLSYEPHHWHWYG